MSRGLVSLSVYSAKSRLKQHLFFVTTSKSNTTPLFFPHALFPTWRPLCTHLLACLLAFASPCLAFCPACLLHSCCRRCACPVRFNMVRAAQASPDHMGFAYKYSLLREKTTVPYKGACSTQRQFCADMCLCCVTCVCVFQHDADRVDASRLTLTRTAGANGKPPYMWRLAPREPR